MLRFHWLKNKDRDKIETFRFTCALFGLNQPPFLLGATTEEHLRKKQAEFLTEVDEITDGIYVDDLFLSGETRRTIEKLKADIIEISKRADFTLHKWHSNLPELEDSLSQNVGKGGLEQSFAKNN